MVKRKKAEKSFEGLIAELDSFSTYIKKNAIVQLVARNEKQASERIGELCRDEEATIRACAAWAVGELGESGAGRTLVFMLKDLDTDVRRAAVIALDTVADPVTKPALREAEKDSDKWVSEIARNAWAKIEKNELVAKLSAQRRQKFA